MRRKKSTARMVAGRLMTPAEINQLRRHIAGFDHIDSISDDMREIIESEFPELVHKLPPKRPH